jgi:prepilin-type processing-associated H-X9-DG protein
MNGKSNRVTSARKLQQAFSLADLIVTILGLVAVVFVLARLTIFSEARSARITCANNLKQVGLAFKTWTLDNGDHYPMELSVTNGGTLEFIEQGLVFPHFQVMSNELSTPKVLRCPEEKSFQAAQDFTTDFNNSKLSYFVGLDANDNSPSSILAGDKNLQSVVTTSNRVLTLTGKSSLGWTRALHSRKGTVLFGDGSVREVENSETRALLKNLGARTNRLAVP